MPKCVKCIRKLKTAFPMEELEDACDLVDSFQDMVDEVEKREIEMLLKKREAKVEQGRAQLLSVQHGVSIPVEITPGPGRSFFFFATLFLHFEFFLSFFCFSNQIFRFPLL